MIGRLLQNGVNLFLCFCAATLLSQIIILGYVWNAWQMDRERVVRMLAVAQGIDTPPHDSKDPDKDVGPEETSYQDWLDRRASVFRDVELRETALQNALAGIKSQERQLADKQFTQRQIVDAFQTRLLELTQGAVATGRDEVRGMLEAMKAPQAKEQLLKMLDNDEIDEVVLLLSGMQQMKRAKILAEFKLPDEGEKVSEVLRLIRQGEPTAAMAADALGQLPGNNPPGG